MLTIEPQVPLSVWLLLAVMTLLLLAWYGAFQRQGIPRMRWPLVLLLMAGAAACPLVLLLNPQWIERIPPPEGRPLLTILIDRSQSMATTDGKPGETRWQAAADMALKARASLQNDFDVEVSTFGQDSSTSHFDHLATQALDDAVTNVAAAIDGVLAIDRPQGQMVYLLSDGIHNAESHVAGVLQSAGRARARAVPVYTTTVGGEAKVRDLETQVRVPLELAFVDQPALITALVHQHGFPGAASQVKLLKDGETLESRRVVLRDNRPSEVTFETKPAAVGLYRYEVQVEPFADEVSAVNNIASMMVRVVDEPAKILLLEGKPYWDTKFLVRTLANDPAAELTAIVQTSPGRVLQRTLTLDRTPGASTAPHQETWKTLASPADLLSDPQSLDPYQIVVLGREADTFLNDTAIANLKRWIERSGGALVCSRGSPTVQSQQPLRALLPVRFNPVRETRFRARLTDRGQELHWLPSGGDLADDPLQYLPTLAASARTDRLKPVAEVVATGISADGSVGDPVVVHQPYGLGRVVVVEGAGMWRWAFLPPEHQEHEQIYATLWRQLTRWLVANAGLLPQQEMAIRFDKSNFNTAEFVHAVLLTREQLATGSVPLVELSGPTKERTARQIRPLPLGDDPHVYRVPIGKLAEGQYQVKVVGGADDDAALRATFDVRTNLREQLDLQPRPELMQRIAADTEGAVIDQPESLHRLLEQHLQRMHPERWRRTPIWDRWWVMFSMLGLWGMSWGLRRYWGRL